MRQEIEDKIGALEAQKQQIETDLAAEKQKLQTMLDTVPAEVHSMTAEVFQKIKAFFEGL